jgi:hypothetical protein
MSLYEEWQLVAHNKDLTAAEGAVAQAIARRIRPGNNSEPIPFRTLYAESVGVSSRETIKRALVRLEALGVIQVSKTLKGSRNPRVISWLLECPRECELDHANGNRRAAKTKLEREFLELSQTEPQELRHSHSVGHDTPTPVGRFKKEKKEREGSLVSFIRETLLELDRNTPLQEQLLEATTDPQLAGEVQARAEQLIVSKEPENPYNYLAAIAKKDPHKLFPKPQTTQAPPNLSHLPAGIREIELAKLNRPDPFAAQKVAAND